MTESTKTMAGTRIADLEIQIQNKADSTITKLNNLTTALESIKRARANLDFRSVVKTSKDGMDELKATVTQLTNIMKPLATQMAKIEKGATALTKMGLSVGKINNANKNAENTASKVTDASSEITDSVISDRTIAVSGTTTVGGDTALTAPTAVEGIKETSMAIDEQRSKLSLLIERLNLLKQKYAEVSASGNGLQANGIKMQILNTEEQIRRSMQLSTANKTLAKSEDEASASSRGFSLSLKQLSINSYLGNLSIVKLAQSFTRLLRLKAMRMIVQQFYASLHEGIANVYEYSRALGSIDSANFKTTMDSYATSMQTLKNTIGATIAQVIYSMLPTIQTLINYLSTAINVINQFFAALNGKSVYTKAIDSATEWASATNNVGSSASGASDAIKEYQKTLLGFDELNVLNSPDTSSGGGGGGGGGGASTPAYTDMFEEAEISDKIQKIADKVKDVINFIKENFDTIWAIVSNIGLALLAWKIASDVANFFGILDKLGLTQNAGKIAFGITLSLIGFTIEALGAYDIGKNGADLKNIIQTALGGALGVLGGVIAFGASSMIVTIPLAILVAISGIRVGEGVANLENDEEFQKWANWVEEAKKSQSRVQEIVENLNTKTDELLSGISDKVTKAQILRDKIFEIVNDDGSIKDGFKNSERSIENLKTLISDFNDLGLSDIQLEFNELTGTINLTRQGVDELIESYKRQAQTEAYLELYKEHYKAIIELQAESARQAQNHADAEAELANWESEHKDRLDELYMKVLENPATAVFSDWYSEYTELTAKDMELNEAVDETKKAYEEADKALKEASGNADVYWDLYEQSASDALGSTQDELSETSASMNDLAYTYQRSIEKINELSIDNIFGDDFYDNAMNMSTLTLDAIYTAYQEGKYKIESDKIYFDCDGDDVYETIYHINDEYAGLVTDVDGNVIQPSMSIRDIETKLNDVENSYADTESAIEGNNIEVDGDIDGFTTTLEEGKTSYNGYKDWITNNPAILGAKEEVTKASATAQTSWNSTKNSILRSPAQMKASQLISKTAKEGYADWNDYRNKILNSPANLTAKDSVTSVGESAYNNWSSKAFPSKDLTGTNKIGTAVNSAYSTWVGKTFPNKNLYGNNQVGTAVNNAYNTWAGKVFPTKSLNATNNVTNAVNNAYNTWNSKGFPTKDLNATWWGVLNSVDNASNYYANKWFPTRDLDSTYWGVYNAVNSAYDYWRYKDFPIKELGASVVLSSSGTVKQYASGGYPDYGTMFIAGENGAGAEMVGNINGRTGVASQGEITGIRQSVEATGANEARLLAEQNSLLRAILVKEGNVSVSTQSIINGLNRANRRTGKSVVQTG